MQSQAALLEEEKSIASTYLEIPIFLSSLRIYDLPVTFFFFSLKFFHLS